MELLTINKKDPNADEDKGPRIDSEDKNERIEARRLRIKKKKDLTQKKQSDTREPLENAKKKEPSKGRKQIQDSRARLVKLEKDGLELVTNIRVAGDLREHERLTEEEEVTRQRKDRLEQEAKSAGEKFDEIVKKWEIAQSKEIPQELHEMLMDQKHLCDSMIDEKNKLINDFKTELKQKDDLYVKTLKKYTDDIDLLIERMRDHMSKMRKFYLVELENVENMFLSERKDLLDKHRKEWDERMEERRTKEVTFLDERLKRVEKNENELNEIRVRNAEEYNELKIKLETDIQKIEQQTQGAKAIYQLNQEKLEYNYQVLVKRDDENSKTKAQQKRKMTKLADTQTNLKRKLAKQIKQLNDENQQLIEEYKRVTDMFNDLKLKSKHFLTTDLKKFHDIWKMNEEQCKLLANNLLDADRIIFEQQLGIEWQPPDVSFMENVGPLNGAHQFKTGKDFVNDLFQSDNEETEQITEENQENAAATLTTLTTTDGHENITNEDSNSMKPDLSSKSIKANVNQQDVKQFKDSSQKILLNLSKRTLRSIVMLICDEAGFLLEQKLVNLLQPLEKNEQSMVKLDAIFKSLGIETENDVKLLAQYFVNHRQFKEIVKNSKNSTNTAKRGADGESNSQTSDANSNPESINTDEAIELIHPNEALTAIKTFLIFHRKQESKHNLAKFRLANLDNRDDTADAEYWNKYENIIDEKKEKMWNALSYALDKYHTVLNRRSELIEENRALANQNMEFRMLLAQYMQSSVNQELQIPPTKTLQMEFSK